MLIIFQAFLSLSVSSRAQVGTVDRLDRQETGIVIGGEWQDSKTLAGSKAEGHTHTHLQRAAEHTHSTFSARCTLIKFLNYVGLIQTHTHIHREERDSEVWQIDKGECWAGKGGWWVTLRQQQRQRRRQNPTKIS